MVSESVVERVRGWFRLRGWSRGERLVGWALLAVTALGLLGYTGSELDVRRRRTNLARAVGEELALLPERQRALVQTMDGVILEAAADPWPGDLTSPELRASDARDAFLRRPAAYVRAALPEVARLDAIGQAVRRSDKDAFVLCLARPPTGDTPGDVRAAATRYWMGGALFEDATHDVLPLAIVHKGLRPLSRAFAAELGEAGDHLSLRRLEDEYELRMPSALTLARTAASVDLLMVVVDELPEGMTAPEVGRSLTATRRPAILPRIEDRPHAVRAVVWDAVSRKVALRVRTRVDVGPLHLDNPAMVAAQVHACQAAGALRTFTAGPPAP